MDNKRIEPGLDLDAMVGIALECKPIGEHYVEPSGWRKTWPHYSTDIAAAWIVVERLELSLIRWRDAWYAGKDFYGNAFWLRREEGNQSVTGLNIDAELYPVAMSDSAPHAICLAALEALRSSEDAR